MRVSASIELLMQMAAQEAIAGEFGEIAPEHLLMALLKLSELPVQEVGKIAPGAEVVRQLAVEVDALRNELAGRSIDSTDARRRLRGVLGNGGQHYEDGPMHRSPACREIFDEAAKLADEVDSETLEAIHLLRAVLASPTPAVKQVLGGALGPKVPKPTETPLLNEHGKDLTRLATEGELREVSGRQAECRVLIEVLGQKKSRGILLVSESNGAARSVVEAVAHVIAGRDCPPELKGRRVIDINPQRSAGKKATETMDLVTRQLAEAAKAPEVILVVPAIEDDTEGEKDSRWPEQLKTALSRGGLRCICQVAPSAYRTQMEKDRQWRRFATTVWVHDQASNEIPTEL